MSQIDASLDLFPSWLVLDAHRPRESRRIQSPNGFMACGTMTVGWFASAGLLAVDGGITGLQASVMPGLFAVAISAVTAAARRARAG